MEENNNSKLGIGILIGILSCLVLVLGGFFVYKQFIEKDEKPSNNIEDNKPISQEQELSLNDKVVLNLFAVY